MQSSAALSLNLNLKDIGDTPLTPMSHSSPNTYSQSQAKGRNGWNVFLKLYKLYGLLILELVFEQEWQREICVLSSCSLHFTSYVKILSNWTTWSWRHALICTLLLWFRLLAENQFLCIKVLDYNCSALLKHLSILALKCNCSKTAQYIFGPLL